MKTKSLRSLLVALGLSLSALHALAQTTAFTYQGRLSDNGAPAQGIYDFRFTIYDAPTAGGSVGTPVTVAPVGVTNGLFTVTLDFGASAFDGSARWLEIGVRTNGSASAHAILAPRQAVTATPYAIQALTAGTAASAAMVTGPIADTQLSANIPRLSSNLMFNGAVTFHHPDSSFSGTFSGNGAGLTNLSVPAANLTGILGASQIPDLDAAKIISGTVPASALGNAWKLGGNAGSVAGRDFLGTTDNQPLEFRVQGLRALRLEPDPWGDGAPNVIGGSPFNQVGVGVMGATIAGGGAAYWFGTVGLTNQVMADFGTIGGGSGNMIQATGATIGGGSGNWIDRDAWGATIGGGQGNTIQTNANFATIPGGAFNSATNYAFAAGHRAKANHTGAFVWADSGDADFASTSNDQFSVRANGGVRFETAGAGIQIDGARVVTSVTGTPGPGKLLLAGANGQVSWQPASVLSAFLGQDYSALLPHVIDNTVTIEISELLVGEPVVLINGPGLAIQRIAGFAGGNPNDQPGPNGEFPLVFEYSGPFESALLSDHQQFTNSSGGARRSISLVVRRLGGSEAARWNLYEMGLTQVEPGTDGRTRYTYQHTLAPNNSFAYERVPASFGTDSSINPDTDGPRVEIEGLLTGPYPAGQIDTNNRTVTLTFDYSENGDIYNWVKTTANGSNVKRAMSLVYEVGGVEVARTNYYGVFPLQFQQFTGFGQYEKLKERVVLSYDVRGAAQ